MSARLAWWMLVVVLLCGLTRSAYAQDSLASVQIEAYPRANRTDREQVSMAFFRAKLGFPIFLTRSKGTLLIPSLTYERFDATVTNSAGQHPLVLHAPAFGLMLAHPSTATNRWGYVASLGIGLASDFSTRLSAEDVAPTALGIVTFRATRQLTIGAGVTYDRRIGTIAPAPLFIVNWQIAESLRLIGAAPASLSFEARVTPWLSAALRGSLTANRFRFGQADYHQNLQIAYLNVGVGPSLIFSLGEYLHLETYGTVALYRGFDISANRDSVTTQSLPPVMGGGARLWFGPSLWKKPGEAP